MGQHNHYGCFEKKFFCTAKYRIVIDEIRRIENFLQLSPMIAKPTLIASFCKAKPEKNP